MSFDGPLFILGSSGLALEIAAYAGQIWPDRTVYFVDRSPRGPNQLSTEEYWKRKSAEGGESIIGAGRCEIRCRMSGEIKPPFATIIHPTSVVLGNVGSGCVIAPGAIVAPNAQVKQHVLVNYNATVGHDAIIDNYCVIGPGSAIGGWCQLDAEVYIGAGALVREQLRVEHGAVVGMGAVVTKDVPQDVIALGVPARAIRKSEASGGWYR